MSVIRKIVFRGNGNCIAIPESLLKFAGLECGGVCALEPAGDGSIRVRRSTPDDYIGQVDISAGILRENRAGSK